MKVLSKNNNFNKAEKAMFIPKERTKENQSNQKP